jgi:hypothetical protein
MQILHARAAFLHGVVVKQLVPRPGLWCDVVGTGRISSL